MFHWGLQLRQSRNLQQVFVTWTSNKWVTAQISPPQRISLNVRTKQSWGLGFYLSSLFHCVRLHSKCLCSWQSTFMFIWFFCSYSVIYNKKKIKDHIWILGENLHTTWKNRAAFLCFSSVEAICTLSPTSLPAKEASDLRLYSWRVSFSHTYWLFFSEIKLCDHCSFPLLDIPCTVTL